MGLARATDEFSGSASGVLVGASGVVVTAGLATTLVSAGVGEGGAAESGARPWQPHTRIVARAMKAVVPALQRFVTHLKSDIVRNSLSVDKYFQCAPRRFVAFFDVKMSTSVIGFTSESEAFYYGVKMKTMIVAIGSIAAALAIYLSRKESRKPSQGVRVLRLRGSWEDLQRLTSPEELEKKPPLPPGLVVENLPQYKCGCPHCGQMSLYGEKQWRYHEISRERGAWNTTTYLTQCQVCEGFMKSTVDHDD